MIKVNHLEKYFNRRQKNEIHVLNDISVEFPEKGLVVLLGASGSGKTTLLNVLGGLDKVQSGIIDFGDQSIDYYDAGTWDKIRNENIGYVFQNYNLLPDLSVYDNIAFVLKMIGITDPEVIDQRVIYILNAVNMYPFRKKKALQLSGGQQQRVAIARALVKNPKVIIADEPTGNLDSKNTLDIMNIIKQISIEKLVVLVTHEKDIAKFYGDRIIEIKDGRIVSDYSNGTIEDQKIGKDDSIYLKDLKTVSLLDDEHVNLSLFTDPEEKSDPISIRLIVKNKTLYLDVDSSYKKIKLVDDSSGVVIKNENFVQKTRQEMIQTTFNLDMLDNKDINRQASALVSLKQTFKMAFRKILTTSRKGKLMLFSFLVAGMVIAFTIATLASVVIVRPEPYMNISRGYILMERTSVLIDFPTYDALMEYKPEDDNQYFINPYSQAEFAFLNPNLTVSSALIRGQIDLADHVKSRDLLAGRLPETDDEILITKVMADDLVKQSVGQEIGIWSYTHIFYENLKIVDHDIKVVGVVDSEIRLIYMTRDMADYYTASLLDSTTTAIPYTFFAATDLVAGNMPLEGQIVISSQYYNFLTGGDIYTGTWPKTIPTLSNLVSGVHDIDGGELDILMTQVDIEKAIFGDNLGHALIYSSDPNTMLTELEGIAGVRVSDVYQTAFDSAKSMQQVVLWSTLGTSALLLGFAMLGFYFVIRSSLISRIYEVSVYRALGVKKTDIFRSFIVEIFVITSMSTLIGYILATLALTKLQAGLLGDFNFFLVTPLTVIFGLVLAYLLNLLAGLFPVFMLLRKTPAQILSQYDI
ncbi:MAG: ATP-binding cassette domain-containing protein [Bacillota bacterium]